MALNIPGPKTEMDFLAQNYRVRQASMAATTALKVGRYWNGVEVGNEESERNFILLSVETVSSGFMETAEDSRVFLRENLGIEGEVVVPNREQMARSLAYIGPVQARKAMERGAGEFTGDPNDRLELEEYLDTRLRAPGEARAHVANRVRGTGVRLAALGGREVVRSAADGRRVGYARVTGSDPCAFCAMLASRRAIFDEDSFDESDPRFTGWGKVKVHDSCQCALIAVTQMSKDQLTQMNYFEQLWKDLAAKEPKETDTSPIATFRRNYDELRATA